MQSLILFGHNIRKNTADIGYQPAEKLKLPMSDLNRPQREAVRYIEGPLLVLAGAGIGEKWGSSPKIVHLIENTGLEPRHIAAVTFTNKAAREMKARVGGLLRGRNSRGLSISLFHTGFEHTAPGILPSLVSSLASSLFDDQDSGNLVKRAFRCRAMRRRTMHAQAISWRISDWKDAMQTPQQAEANARMSREARAARPLHLIPERSLRAYNAVDFDDHPSSCTASFERFPATLRSENRPV